MNMPKPDLTFFCELDAQALADLFEGRFIMDDLLGLNANLSMGIRDLTDTRANVVKRLNKAGVPVIAWLLLPEEEGYWFNISNHEKATERYLAFKAWSEKHQLSWAGVGLDIEMDINDIKQLSDQQKALDVVKKIFSRFFDRQRVAKAQQAYQALVAMIHDDGYVVESYHIPLISEERRGGSTVLQRSIGLVDITTDREVFMLYSSFLRPDGDSVLWSYAPETDSIGVGNTGGGVDLESVGDIPPLTWEEFTRDLRLCVIQEKPIHIFCLEGCVEQGFLSKLNTFDWDKPVTIPAALQKVKAIRTGITASLWTLERPWVILLGLAALIGLGFLFKQNKKR
jgi:hypothetical protein